MATTSNATGNGRARTSGPFPLVLNHPTILSCAEIAASSGSWGFRRKTG